MPAISYENCNISGSGEMPVVLGMLLPRLPRPPRPPVAADDEFHKCMEQPGGRFLEKQSHGPYNISCG